MNAPFLTTTKPIKTKAPAKRTKRKGGKRKHKRADFDFYPTPTHVTEALLKVEKFPGLIWEPACGAGHICKVFEEQGCPITIATDLFTKGNYGTSEIDFLQTEIRVDHIVTNPPYKIAEKFIRHALSQAECKVAMLLQLSFLESAIRERFFDDHPPARIWVIRNRLTLYSYDDIQDGKDTGKGQVAMAWFVWDQSHRGRPTIDWLSVK